MPNNFPQLMDKIFYYSDGKFICFLILSCILSLSCHAQEPDLWVRYEGKEGPGKGKYIVLISGDDEYRSEEGLPMLGKILAERYGYEYMVQLANDQQAQAITPNYTHNIPGLEQLEKTDLMIMLLRFRQLPV